MGGKGSGRKPGSGLSPCGTVAKYQWHRKRGENCALCREAAAAHRRSKYVKKQRQTGPLKAQRNRDLVRLEKFARGACMDCGLVINEQTIVCIDFDHRNPQDKAFTIAYEMHRASESELRAEMAKCDAVCRNCHAIRTHQHKHHLVRRQASAIVLPLFDN